MLDVAYLSLSCFFPLERKKERRPEKYKGIEKQSPRRPSSRTLIGHGDLVPMPTSFPIYTYITVGSVTISLVFPVFSSIRLG